MCFKNTSVFSAEINKIQSSNILSNLDKYMLASVHAIFTNLSYLDNDRSKHFCYDTTITKLCDEKLRKYVTIVNKVVLKMLVPFI